MTLEQKKIKLAEKLGWKWYRSLGRIWILLKDKPANPTFEGPLEPPPEFIQKASYPTLPNWPEDLNACHEVE